MPILPFAIIRPLLFFIMVASFQVGVGIDELNDGRLERSYLAEWRDEAVTVIRFEDEEETRFFAAEMSDDPFVFEVRRYDSTGSGIVEEVTIDLTPELEQFGDLYLIGELPPFIESEDGDRWSLQYGLAAAFLDSEMLSRRFVIGLPTARALPKARVRLKKPNGRMSVQENSQNDESQPSSGRV